MSTYRTTYHRDGTITVWDVYSQQWVRLPARELWDDARLMSTLSDTERQRIARAARPADRGGA